MDEVGAFAGAMRYLLPQHAAQAEAVRTLSKKLGNPWRYFSVLGAAFLAGLGREYDLHWLQTLGIAVAVGMVCFYVAQWIDHNRAKRELDSINWRIWDQETRWQAIGGYSGLASQLRAIYDKERDEFDRDKYASWWAEVKQGMIRKATLVE